MAALFSYWLGKTGPGKAWPDSSGLTGGGLALSPEIVSRLLRRHVE